MDSDPLIFLQKAIATNGVPVPDKVVVRCMALSNLPADAEAPQLYDNALLNTLLHGSREVWYCEMSFLKPITGPLSLGSGGEN